MMTFVCRLVGLLVAARLPTGWSRRAIRVRKRAGATRATTATKCLVVIGQASWRDICMCALFEDSRPGSLLGGLAHES